MKYNAYIISQCNWASDEPGYSDARTDYPYVIGPGQDIYDYVNIMRPWGRHPDTGAVLWVDEPNTARRLSKVDEEGIDSMGSDVVPPLNHPIDASLCNCKISADGPVSDIDEDAKYLIWGLESLLEDPVYPAGKEDWQMDLPVSAERINAFDAFMMARGTPEQVLDDYWIANPNATYRQVAEDFAYFL